MRFLIPALLLFLLLNPVPASAEVVINEIAWMGTSVSANDEWIELYNSGGSPVDLSGWALHDTGTLSIALEGSISAGGYYLLERTDDETVPGIAANVIYTGALSNEGRTLTLKRADGSTENQAAGGENWQSIGGDNTTKDTAQRRAGGGWITAAPTPKAANASSGESSSDDLSDDSDTDSNESGSSSSSSGTLSGSQASGGGSADDYQLKKRQLFRIDVEGPTAMIAGAAQFFEATAYDTDGRKLSAVEYTWNFGNGTTLAGASVLHQYDYPGSYVAQVRATAPDGRIAEESFVIDVDPLELSIPGAHTGAIEIANKASRNADLSGWSLRSGNQVFLFPLGTMILVGETVSFPASVTGLSVSNPRGVALVYPDGRVAVAFGAALASADNEIKSAPIVQTENGVHGISAGVPESEPLVSSITDNDDEEDESAISDNQAAALGAAAPRADGGVLLPWLLALFALLTTSVAAVLYLKRKEASSFTAEQTTKTISEEAKQFKIVED